MTTRISLCRWYALLLAMTCSVFVQGVPQRVLSAEMPAALEDPIPQSVPPGEVVVALSDFIRLPQTTDSAQPPQTNQAYARIQYLQPLPDRSGRLVVNDLRGLLYLVDARDGSFSVYLDLREQNVGFDDSMFPNETGLAGVAFHPDFGNPGTAGYGRFYTAFSAGTDTGKATYRDDPDNNHESVIREWTALDAGADRFTGSSREILRVGQFAQNHNIGTLAFNPAASTGEADFGLLYASFGDGGGANDPNENGQDLSTPLSSIIRIDPLGGSEGRAYGIPGDNPFIGQPGAAPEIWAYGLRHPQHFSFDQDGTLYIADIGQSQIEEVNRGVAGANYGWRIREGTFATAFDPSYLGSVRPGPVYPKPADATPIEYPVLQYDHAGSSAIGSVFVYRGAGIPALQGKLVIADMVTGKLFYAEGAGLQPGNPARLWELQVSDEGRLIDIAEAVGMANTYAQGKRADIRLGRDAAGELYLLSKGDGWIRRLVAT